MAQHIVDGLLHPGGKPHADRRGIVPVGVGRAHGTHVDAQRHGLAQRGRHRGDSGRNAVVGQFRHDDAAGARMAARNAQRQVVGLAAGAREHRLRQRGRERGHEALGVFHHAVVQIARVRVQHRGLLGNGRDHARMAMAHRRHIVVGVQNSR
ncbi:hypothetical protein G6F68_015458 [Rhizopus microsporus]|nr:hypothetical protein G6F68_015458 [Rhizopus microsporus]